MRIQKVCVRIGEVRQTEVKFESKRCEVELEARLEDGDVLANVYDRLHTEANRQVSAFFEDTPAQLKAKLQKYQSTYGKLS